jgi:flavin reductase (DIM6/NTAB) family NADH-FMN oxidoreductase RutF
MSPADTLKVAALLRYIKRLAPETLLRIRVSLSLFYLTIGGGMKKSVGAKTLLFPTPVLMVGTYDRDGKPNLMNAAWGGICCSDPPCVTVSVRKARYTYDCIEERKAFTVGIACEDRMAEADYVGIISGRTVDKFAVSGLTPVAGELVDAPYAAEFPVVLECRLLHTIELGVHTQFIGEIIDVKADADVFAEDGSLDIMKIKPLVYDPSGKGYHGVGPLLGKAFSIGKTKG